MPPLPATCGLVITSHLSSAPLPCCQVALGQRPCLSVFGHDYPTPDGTCVRDYIHVMDLAEGHTAAVDKLFATPDIGCIAYNLGTGTGTSVLEMIKVASFPQSQLAAVLTLAGLRVPGAFPGRCIACHTQAQGMHSCGVVRPTGELQQLVLYLWTFAGDVHMHVCLLCACSCATSQPPAAAVCQGMHVCTCGA